MKRNCQRFLCWLLLCFLPFSSARGEPARWLDPWIAASQGDLGCMRGVFAIEADSEAILSYYMPLFDAALLSPDRMLDTTEDEAALQEAQLRQALSLVLQTMKTYLGASAALAEQMTVQLETNEQAARFAIFLAQEPVAEFTLLSPDEGPHLLLSDLFPSFALELSEESTDPAPAQDTLVLGEGLSLSFSTTGMEPEMQQLLTALPDYADFHFLSAMVDAARMELNALTEQGLAQRSEETLRYIGTDEELEAHLEKMDLPYDPLLQRMMDALQEQQDAAEGAPLPLSVFSQPNTEAQEVSPVPTDAPAETPMQTIFEITGNEVRRESWRVHAYTAYDETTNPETGAVSRVARPAEWEERTSLRLTPETLTLDQVQGPDSHIAVTVDASEKDAIAFSALLRDNGMELPLSCLLTRTEEGQTLTSLLGTEAAGLTMRLNESDVQTITLPALRYVLHLANDFSVFDLAMESFQADAWRPMMRLSFVGERLSEAPLLPDAKGKTRLAADRWGEYSDPDYRTELRLAVPRLNLLALTRLPQEARPLLTPLLSLIGSLGQ